MNEQAKIDKLKVRLNAFYGTGETVWIAAHNKRVQAARDMIGAFSEACFKMGESFATDTPADFLERASDKIMLQIELIKAIDALFIGDCYDKITN